jgi:hypothetical protein
LTIAGPIILVKPTGSLFQILMDVWYLGFLGLSSGIVLPFFSQ